MSKDFSKMQLYGHHFCNQNLAGTNFQQANIQGAKFTNCILTNADFSGAMAGLQKHIAFFLICCALLLIAFLAIISGIGGFFALTTWSYSISAYQLITKIIVLSSLVSFIIITNYKGFVIGIFSAIVFLCPVLVIGTVLNGDSDEISRAFFVGMATLSMISSSLIGITILTTVISIIIESIPITNCIVFIAATLYNIGDPNKVACFSGIIVCLLASYFSWQSLVGNKKFSWIKSLAVFLAATGGTTFRGSDLTGANFSQAILKHTDFREAILIHTCWSNAKKLDLARAGKTYLHNPDTRQLVITKRGEDKEFNRLDLRGVNLQGASLAGTSFIAADLSKANLQYADLSRAKLVQTQLDQTDFTGATLTGACIEDWGITSTTQLDEVRCDYVFMRSPTAEDPNPRRKPDDWEQNFEDGEFTDFIAPIVKTLDLYHNKNIDPRAIALAFEKLVNNNPDAGIDIVSMEKRGKNKDKFLLRVETVAEADHSKLSGEYFSNYNYLKTLPESEIKLLLAEKDNQISKLETMVMAALEHCTSSATKKILILAANPKTTSPLRLDEEVREIDTGLQRSKKREQFDLKQRWAVRVRDVYQALLDFKPCIVHFSGHGTGEDGLALEDETGNIQLINTEALAELFELFSEQIECVLLNACYSQVQAEAIAEYIPYVIGMNTAIGDKAAIEFAVAFYNAIGSGESIDFAYQLGCKAIRLAGFAEHLTPILKKKQERFCTFAQFESVKGINV